MGTSDLPSILRKVDLLSVFGLTVEDVSDSNGLNVLRQKFLHKAKQCHPDKQAVKAKADSDEFAILKAAYDHLAKDGNLERYIAARKSHSTGFSYEHVETVISAKQAKLKAELDRRIREFRENYAKQQKPTVLKREDNSTLMNYYSEILTSKSQSFSHNAADAISGKINVIVTAPSKVKEISLLVKSNHFLDLFSGFGVVSISPTPNYSQDKPEIAKIIFNSTSNAILALLYYRQHKSLFRNDLYSLAFVSESDYTNSNKTNNKKNLHEKNLHEKNLHENNLHVKNLHEKATNEKILHVRGFDEKDLTREAATNEKAINEKAINEEKKAFKEKNFKDGNFDMKEKAINVETATNVENMTNKRGVTVRDIQSSILEKFKKRATTSI